MITRYSLILSYFFTAWNTRADAWAITLFLSIIYPNTLLPSSIYFFSTSLTVFLIIPIITAHINMFDKLKIAVSLILMQKICIINSAALLWFKAASAHKDFRPDCIFLAIVFNGCILQLANSNSKIIIEKDWAVHVAKCREDVTLEFLNSRLRFVDLFSDMMAPLVISYITEEYSSQVGMLFVGFISLLSIFIEIGLLVGIYNHTITLKSPNSLNQDQGESDSLSITNRLLQLLKNPVSITSLSISFLYLTVLTINTVMISYLLSQGNSIIYISCIRILSVVCGLIATFTVELLIKRLGIDKAGLFAITFQLGCLSIVISSFYIHLDSLTPVLFLVGVCLSRWGLWSFDLIQQQLIQERIPENDIGLVCGIEVSIQSLFQLLAFSLTMIWSEPAVFWIPVHVSFVSVIAGCMTYILFYFKSSHVSYSLLRLYEDGKFIHNFNN